MLHPGWRFLARTLPGTIQNQVLVMVAVVVLLQILVSGVIYASLVSSILKQQIGKRALDIAQSVAAMPVTQEALLAGKRGGLIQTLTEDLRRRTEAEFIVVGDRDGLRLSHPNPEKIGRAFVGGDIDPALNEGSRYTSEAIGTLGPSLRGIVPVQSATGDIIGFVAVGYLIEDVRSTIRGQQQQPVVFIFFMGLIGLISAQVIAKYFKAAILGLEPKEIASLYQERGAILESIREGVIATDTEGTVRLVNRAACRYTGEATEDDLIGREACDLLPCPDAKKVLSLSESRFDCEGEIAGQEMIFNMVPIEVENEPAGLVATFRRKDELDQLARELVQVREYSEMLRVQSHEYSNTLHTIAGLLQLKAYDEALELLLKETSGYQDFIQFLGQAVPHPLLSAIIIGKYNHAREQKVLFDVDRDSSMVDIPAHINQEALVTVIGNLIDNALDAVRGLGPDKRTVILSMTDLGKDLIFEVEDSGPGIPVEDYDQIFEKGFTSKQGEKRGVGLFLVAKRLKELGGVITIGQSAYGGALFTLSIPKGKQ